MANHGYRFFTAIGSNGDEFLVIRGKTVTDFLPIPPKSAGVDDISDRTRRAEDAARKLEATFLAEMLKAAGLGEQDSSFSGGAGEDQFASFHRQAVAERIAAAGGLGLAEHFLRSMMEAGNET
jgi:Rod binding domain-containing protein